MEPRGDQSQRPDEQSPPPQRPAGYDVPVQRRPPLSRGFDARPIARRPAPESTPPVSQPVSPPPVQPPTFEPLAEQPIETAREPEPVVQMPQPASFSPPPMQQAGTLPEQEPAPQIQQSSGLPPAVERRDFTPPVQKLDRRRWLYPAIAAVSVLILGAGIFGYTKALAARNNPHNVMQNALENSLSLSNAQSTTRSGSNTVTTQYDFASKQPVTSTEASLVTPKGQASLKGYGDLKNTYINYANLPKTVNPNIAKQMSTAWVQVRQDGVLPKNTPNLIFKVSDPRYQAFGPVLMGNFEGKTREELLSFIAKNKVYGYDETKVKKDTLGDEAVFVFPIKLDVSYLKVASQSVAVSMGLEPSETQLAVDDMESLRDATVALYIRASDHTIARMSISKEGATKTIDISGYKETKLPAPPQTKLLWQGFVPLQNQIETQASLTKSTY